MVEISLHGGAFCMAFNLLFYDKGVGLFSFCMYFQMFFSAIKFHEPNEFKVASNIRDTLNGFKQENNQPQKHWERGRGKHHHGAKINFDQQNAEKAREYVMNQITKKCHLGGIRFLGCVFFIFNIFHVFHSLVFVMYCK